MEEKNEDECPPYTPKADSLPEAEKQRPCFKHVQPSFPCPL
jgi:hypothetical protein